MNKGIGENGLALIKKWESLRLRAYKDSVGIPTIGYGTIRVDGVPVKMGDTCTVEQAEHWLLQHINDEVESCINRVVKVELNQNQFDALCSFIYNLGCSNFSKSTLLKNINAENFNVAYYEFQKWNRAGGKVLLGLTNRRQDEANLFIS